MKFSTFQANQVLQNLPPAAAAGLNTTVTLGPTALMAGGVTLLMHGIDLLYTSANGIVALMHPQAGLTFSFTPMAGKRYRIGGDLKVPSVDYSYSAGGKIVSGSWSLYHYDYLTSPVMTGVSVAITVSWSGGTLLRTLTFGPA